MEHLSNVAEIVFIGLCCRLGTPTQVTIKREIVDILEIVLSLMKKGNSHFVHRISGSYRDGFRFESSDLDMMLWCTNNIVICELSQFMGFYASDENIILMEYLENPPGFVKLKLLTPTRNLKYLYFSVVSMEKIDIYQAKYSEIKISNSCLHCPKSVLGICNLMVLLLTLI